MKQALFGLALLAALPFASQAAEGVSYSYLEAGYLGSRYDYYEWDAVTGSSTHHERADGWAVRGAGAIAPNFHVFGSYSSLDFAPLDNHDALKLGIGYHHEINSNVDLLTRVAYDRLETDFADYTGWSVEAGVRASLAHFLEGYALAGYEDFDSDSRFYGRLGAQFKFNALWGINGEVKLVEGHDEYFIGPRITF